jgi:predicted nucleic acid-binding protein
MAEGDPGKLEAIWLAQELGADLLLMDDWGDAKKLSDGP